VVFLLSAMLQMANDIAKAKADIAAAEQRQREVQQMVQQAKQGKEDSVSNTTGLIKALRWPPAAHTCNP
jgi:hypothetical protein